MTLLGTGACSLVPAYHTPGIAAAASWQSPVQSSPTATAVRADWWRQFGSPGLDDLENQGLAGSLTLQAAVARIHEAEGVSRIAGAPLFPTLSVAGTATASSRSTSSATGQQLLAQTSYELDFWGRNRATADSSVALVRASAFDAGTVAMTLSATVADDYFTILSLRERLSLAQQTAADARQVLRLIEVQRAAGTATDLQVHQQETVVATQEAAVPALERTLAATTHALAILTGQPPEGFTAADEPLDQVHSPAIRPDLPPQLLALRPDIQAAEARLVSANFDIGAARAAFFPTLSLSAGAGLTRATAAYPHGALATAGASLLAPLFAGGQLDGQVKQAKAYRLELIATYRQTVLTAYGEVEDALSAIDTVGRQATIEAAAVTSARQAADLARIQYQAGSADYLTVLTTQQTLYQARDTLAQLHLQQLQATVSLCRALGGGFGDGGRAQAISSPSTGYGPQTGETSQ